MSESESENWKKNEIYAKGEDSDYDIEEENEARKIQDKRLKRIIDQGLLDQNNELDNEETNENVDIDKLLEDSEDEAANAKSKISDALKKDLASKAIEVKKMLQEIKDRIDPVLGMLTENEDIVSNPEAIKYFEAKKSLILSYCGCLSYYIINRRTGRINDYHPSIKKIISLKTLIQKLNDTKVFNKIDEYIEKLEEYNNDGDDEEEEIEKVELKQQTKIKKEIKTPEETLLNKKRYKEKDEENEQKSKSKVGSSYKIMEEKNELAIKKANKDLAKGRGMYRKRKAKQGNAKLMNKMKFEKKQKVRNRYVKEFKGAPLVNEMHGTGVRADLSRSTKFK